MKKFVPAITIGLLLFSANSVFAAQARQKAPPAAAATLDQRLLPSADGTVAIGDPAAPVKLVEFISYTCPHCAHFNEESHAELREGLVRSGKVSVEVQPFLRNEFDQIASLLVTCGPKARWFGNHDAVLAAQETWFKEPSDPTYQQRWQALDSDRIAQRKVVARDLGLTKLMLGRGYTPAQLDACLADEVRAGQFVALTDQAVKDGVNGTPSFKINGKLQDVYGWLQLKPLIQDALLPPATI